MRRPLKDIRPIGPLFKQEAVVPRQSNADDLPLLQDSRRDKVATDNNEFEDITFTGDR